MPGIHLRLPAPTGMGLWLLIERLSDGAYLDFNGAGVVGSFSVNIGSCVFSTTTWTTPLLPIFEVSAMAGIAVRGMYEMTLNSPNLAQFLDTDYAAKAIDVAGNVIQATGFSTFNGDDTSLPPIDVIFGVMVSGTATDFVLSGLPAGKDFAGGEAYYQGETRSIVSSPPVGGNYTIHLNASGTGKTRPFSAPPSVGARVLIAP